MVYGIILAAGVGKRFKKKTIKPLFNINNQSLFLYALNTFLVSKQIDKVLLVINEKYQTHFKKCLSNVKYKNVMICSGDQNARWKSLVKGMQYLQNHFHLKPNDIIVTHDAARINVSNKIIFDNITTASKQGYASTVLALHDSIIKLDKQASYLERSHKYIVQTPQTFQYKYWKEHLPRSNRNITDLFTYLGLTIKKSHLVSGSLLNFKITTIEDLKLI